MEKKLDKCMLCPRNCMVNRNKNELGFCRIGNKMKIALAYLHKWEEPSLTGKYGSGTIFFSSCNLKCLYCQNYEISTKNKGRVIEIDEFAKICLDLQKKKATNINLVTPTMYVPLIIEGLKQALKEGLKIPVVYNTSSYENVETIEMLKGYVDVYLPDLKYYDDSIAIKYSKCKDYFYYATLAIDKMYEQVGKVVFDTKGNIKKGVIVRHLVLPGHIEDSKKIIKYLYQKYKNNIYLSIMSQYTPLKKCIYDNLNRRLTQEEYDEVINYAIELGVENAYIQEEGCASESFIPKF